MYFIAVACDGHVYRLCYSNFVKDITRLQYSYLFYVGTLILVENKMQYIKMQ